MAAPLPPYRIVIIMKELQLLIITLVTKEWNEFINEWKFIKQFLSPPLLKKGVYKGLFV